MQRRGPRLEAFRNPPGSSAELFESPVIHHEFLKRANQWKTNWKGVTLFPSSHFSPFCGRLRRGPPSLPPSTEGASAARGCGVTSARRPHPHCPVRRSHVSDAYAATGSDSEGNGAAETGETRVNSNVIYHFRRARQRFRLGLSANRTARRQIGNRRTRPRDRFRIYVPASQYPQLFPEIDSRRGDYVKAESRSRRAKEVPRYNCNRHCVLTATSLYLENRK